MSDYIPTRAELLKLATRCDDGANALLIEARDAAEILPGRAGGDQADPQEWAERKRQAALVAREYAAKLRRLVAAMGPAERPTAERYAQAEAVAVAAELGGILIDGRRMAERTATDGSIWHEYEAQLWQAGTHPAQIKAETIEATGLFAHVAETINGVDQVPFWQLGGPVKPAGCTCPCRHAGGCLTCGCTCPAADAAGNVCACCGADDGEIGTTT